MTHALSSQTIADISVIGAIVVPLVTSLLKREHWSASVKMAIAIVVSVAVAAAAIAVTDRAAFGLGLVQLAALVFAASQIAYRAVFRSSPLEQFLAWLGSRVGPAVPVLPSPAPAPSAPGPVQVDLAASGVIAAPTAGEVAVDPATVPSV